MRKNYKGHHNNKGNKPDIFKRRNKNAKQSVITKVKKSFNNIIVTLNVPYKEFDAQKTINAIVSYLNEYGNAKIAYYTIITEVIYFSKDKSIDTLSGNVERCLSEVIKFKQKCKKDDGVDTNNNSSIPIDSCSLSIKDMQQCEQIYRMLIKIADHASLASYQIGRINKVEENLEKKVDNIVFNSIDSIKEKVRNDFKGLEKDHITILGIFVAIVLAFMGSVIIPANFLNHVKELGIAKSILFLDLIALFFLNMLYQLLKFIMIINEKDKLIFDLYKIVWVNGILISIFLFTLIFAIIPDQIYNKFISFISLPLDVLITRHK